MEALGAILGHLGEKLGYLERSWRQVGTLWQHVGGKMAKMSEDIRTWGENGWLKAMKYGRDGAAVERLSARREVPRA